MKRLILMGGRPWLAKDGGEAFAHTLFRYFTNEVKLAFCIFAQPESDWSETTKVNQEMFSKFGKRKIEYKTMTHANFAEVSIWAEVIYIPGGDPFKLLKEVKACGDVAKLWDGKVIAGSSAGADIMCNDFISLKDKSFGQGLGWVKATCIPHWRNDFDKRLTDKEWDEVETKAINKFPDQPLLTIPESSFVEFSVS